MSLMKPEIRNAFRTVVKFTQQKLPVSRLGVNSLVSLIVMDSVKSL